MRSTIPDRIALGSMLAVAVITAGSLVYAVAVEHRAEELMGTTYGQPGVFYDAAMAAGKAADAEEAGLVSRDSKFIVERNDR